MSTRVPIIYAFNVISRGNLTVSHAVAWEEVQNLSSIGMSRILALTVKDLSPLEHRFEANTYHDVKLKKLARRIKNIYDLDC